jgi:hypothetical protein
VSVFHRCNSLPRIGLTGHATEVVVTARDDAGLIGCCYAEQCRMEDASEFDSEHIDPRSTTTRSAAEGYARNGWSVIPVPHRSKNPGFKRWEQLRLSVTNSISISTANRRTSACCWASRQAG